MKQATKTAQLLNTKIDTVLQRGTLSKETMTSKTSHLFPDPHILHDLDNQLDLARIDGHHITIRDDGTCESYFKVTSLGATPVTARLIYEFIDSNNSTIGRWDAGKFPVDCGVMNQQNNPSGNYNGSLYDRIVAVECPVPGTWVWCDGGNDE
ncbi:hypothetical protein [Paenibacillus sp. 1A_MP2]|uniref:hypothetical protein n=1 Tax=Paenibacillus sp. 1A_MP2 TaxID=3457495 RepID=UPI003FCE88DE